MITEAGAGSAETVDVNEAALTMAIALVTGRIQSLPDEDRKDLFELLSCTNTEEEWEGARRAIREILVPTSVKVKKLDLSQVSGHGLKNWLDYVSTRIRSLRKRTGLTQTQLAERSGIPQGHISNLERGKHSPSFATLEKLAGALGVPVFDLDPSA